MTFHKKPNAAFKRIKSKKNQHKVNALANNDIAGVCVRVRVCVCVCVCVMGGWVWVIVWCVGVRVWVGVFSFPFFLCFQLKIFGLIPNLFITTRVWNHWWVCLWACVKYRVYVWNKLCGGYKSINE